MSDAASNPNEGLRTAPIVVRDGSGSTQAAELLSCPCGSSEFVIYFILPGRHRHLQCASCGMSYCAHEGPCGEATR